MKKSILLSALLLLAPVFLSSAQDEGDREQRRGFAPSRFSENWFLQGGGGLNAVLDNGTIGPLSPAAQLYVGKWITTDVGLRVGAHGFRNVANNLMTGWFSAERPFDFGHADLDVLWNISNTIAGYKEKRFWDFVPYARFAGVMARDMPSPAIWEFGAGAGLMNELRLSRRVDLTIDASIVAAREKAFRESGGVAWFPTVTAGISVRLGKTGFRKKSQTVYREVEKYLPQDTVFVTRREVVKDSVLIERLRSNPLTLYFDIDISVLTQREIDHLEFYLKNGIIDDSTRIILVGSADRDTGTKRRNQILSEERAAHVKDLLVRKYGIRADMVMTVAEGDWNNIYDTPEKNRCVTLYVDGGQYEKVISSFFERKDTESNKIKDK